jgi:PKD repeat protein
VKLNFRQGIVRHQTDVSGNPTFLQRSSGTGEYVDLVISPDPCVLAFAHRDANYIVEEVKTVKNAWGPITTPATRYLYWDVNLLTGTLTRGMTLVPPMYASGAPPSPVIDQHWFDTDDNVFRVWTTQGWSERVRLFAGHVTSGAIIRPARIGSQAGLVGNAEGGNIVLDSFNRPLREANGAFVTTISKLSAVNMGTVVSRLESTIVQVMADEEIPKNSLIQLRLGGRAVLARSTEYRTRVAGLVVEDLYEGEVGKLFTSGVVRSTDWNFSTTQINRPLFCGAAGEVTLVPPKQGVLQQIGFVYDAQSIYLNLHQVLVIDNPYDSVAPAPPPPLSRPIANFIATPVIGTAPMAVTFTSTAVNATQIEWDFTNDGFVDATGASATYTFSTPGTYTVRQRAINSFGQDDEIKASFINVSQPAKGPTFTNLGISFGAPGQVTGGQQFTFQTFVSNDGLANATNVQRIIKLRANNNTQITMVVVPPGATVSYAGNRTTITLAPVNILSGGTTTATITAQVNSNVTSIQLQGTVTSPEVDSTLSDNAATVTIGVKP